MLIELKNRRRKEVKDALAKVLIARGLGVEVTDEAMVVRPSYDQTYSTRMMQAAPYGYKADGEPRKRPGRAAKEA